MQQLIRDRLGKQSESLVRGYAERFDLEYLLKIKGYVAQIASDIDRLLESDEQPSVKINKTANGMDLIDKMVRQYVYAYGKLPYDLCAERNEDFLMTLELGGRLYSADTFEQYELLLKQLYPIMDKNNEILKAVRQFSSGLQSQH